MLASSRGQKSVSLSSAEAELNALVSGAADGIYLKRCLEFLVEEEVMHYTAWLTTQRHFIYVTERVQANFDTLLESCCRSRIWWHKEVLKSKQ